MGMSKQYIEVPTELINFIRPRLIDLFSAYRALVSALTTVGLHGCGEICYSVQCKLQKDLHAIEIEAQQFWGTINIKAAFGRFGIDNPYDVKFQLISQIEIP